MTTKAKRFRPLLFHQLENRRLLTAVLPELVIEEDVGVVLTVRDGSEAIRVNGIGDLNGDGLADLVISGHGVDSKNGTSYVIFGSVDPDIAFFHSGTALNEREFRVSPEWIDGWNGFSIPDYGLSFGGNRVEIGGVGDVTGDGIDDLALTYIDRTNSGSNRVDILPGSRDPFSAIEPVSERGGGVFSILVGDHLKANAGGGITGGDINGDGLSDIIISANGTPNVFVVFGASSRPFETDVDLLDGDNGFVFRMREEDGQAGVSSVGDVNADGFDDIMVTSPKGEHAYILFGAENGFNADLSVQDLDGQNGFVIRDENPRGLVALGDVNDDGVEDFAITEQGFFSIRTAPDPGARIIFGSSDGFPAVLDTESLSQKQGFVISGFTFFSDDPVFKAPIRIVGPGDVNGDGVDDILLGNRNHYAEPFGDYRGAVYVLFGGPAVGSTTNIANINPNTGFGFQGHSAEVVGDVLGDELSHLGDFNGDGIDEILFKPGSAGDSRAVIIYGEKRPLSGDVDDNGKVNFNDFLALANNFGRSDDVTREDGDLDEDGVVSFLDFLILANNFGRTASLGLVLI